MNDRNKKLIRDVEPPGEKKSIRRVNIDRQKPVSKTQEQKFEKEYDQPETDDRHEETEKTSLKESYPTYKPNSFEAGNTSYLSRRRKRYPKIMAWILGIVSLAIIFVAAGSFFSKVEVVITPRSETVEMDKVYTAFEIAQNAGDFDYEIMTLSRTAEEEISSRLLEEKEVNEKASGQITIYNEFSEQDQRLVKNTRFETADGRIYRIAESAVVPGYTEDENGIVPGSLTVTVYADRIGENYNLESGDFTIPGFEGMPQFERFYASTASPITGGFSGTRKVVPEAERDRLSQTLIGRLTDELKESAKADVPEEFVLYDGMTSVRLVSMEPIEEGDSAKFRAKAELTGVMFKRDKFAKNLGQRAVSEMGFDNSSVEIRNIDELNASLADEDVNFEDGEVSFEVKGRALIVWLYDESEIRNELAGLDRDDGSEVFDKYVDISIEKANLIMRPFWKDSFPQDPNEIELTEKLQNEEV